MANGTPGVVSAANDDSGFVMLRPKRAPLAPPSSPVAPVTPAVEPLPALPDIPPPVAVREPSPLPESAMKEAAFEKKEVVPTLPQSEPAPPVAAAPQTPVVTAPALPSVAADTPRPVLAVASSDQGRDRGLEDASFLKSLTGRGSIVALDANGGVLPGAIREPVHLAEAVALSLKNNTEVQASEAKSGGAWYEKLGAYSEYAPSVEMSWAKGQEHSAPSSVNDEFGNRLMDSTHTRIDRSMVVRQPLVDVTVINDILKQTNNESIADADQRDVREGVAYDTIVTFLKLIESRIAVQLADQYQTYLDTLAERMKARVEGGGATDADLERIKGRSTLAESAKVEAMGQYQTNLFDFTRITKITPSEIRIPDVLTPSVPLNIEEALSRAMVINPAYESSLRKVDAAVADRNQSLARMVPKLSLQYAKNFTYNAGGSALGNPVDGVYPDQQTSSLMVVMQWALNGGTSIASAMAGVKKQQEMRLKADDVSARLEQAVRTAYQSVTAADRRIVILKKAVASDEKVVTDFEAQYKDGSRSLFDLLDAYEQLYGARMNLMRVVVAKAQATFLIRRQMGDLVQAILGSDRG